MSNKYYSPAELSVLTISDTQNAIELLFTFLKNEPDSEILRGKLRELQEHEAYLSQQPASRTVSLSVWIDDSRDVRFQYDYDWNYSSNAEDTATVLRYIGDSLGKSPLALLCQLIHSANERLELEVKPAVIKFIEDTL